MKTFDDLIQQVLKPGLCHRCGACVAFCAAINYGVFASAKGAGRWTEEYDEDSEVTEIVFEFGIPDGDDPPDDPAGDEHEEA